ncbi:hypothetical protein C8R43DRAFT_1235794 [Mycena crocata]|nr:hypothetical protein C8R43DRAFT_1235794 [Mycena crocata]
MPRSLTLSFSSPRAPTQPRRRAAASTSHTTRSTERTHNGDLASPFTLHPHLSSFFANKTLIIIPLFPHALSFLLLDAHPTPRSSSSPAGTSWRAAPARSTWSSLARAARLWLTLSLSWLRSKRAAAPAPTPAATASAPATYPPQPPADDPPERECLLCLSAPREVVLLPCRHLVACRPCAVNMVEFGAGGAIVAEAEPATSAAPASTTATSRARLLVAARPHLKYTDAKHGTSGQSTGSSSANMAPPRRMGRAESVCVTYANPARAQQAPGSSTKGLSEILGF